MDFTPIGENLPMEHGQKTPPEQKYFPTQSVKFPLPLLIPGRSPPYITTCITSTISSWLIINSGDYPLTTQPLRMRCRWFKGMSCPPEQSPIK
jgi:hypothetical protein